MRGVLQPHQPSSPTILEAGEEYRGLTIWRRGGGVVSIVAVGARIGGGRLELLEVLRVGLRRHLRGGVARRVAQRVSVWCGRGAGLEARGLRRGA